MIKLDDTYKYLNTFNIMKLLYEHRKSFTTDTNNDKQRAAMELYQIDSIANIIDNVKNELIKLNVTNSNVFNVFVVVQMYMIHHNMLKKFKK